MSMCCFITTLGITSFLFNSLAYACDNSPLQDICVAANNFKATVFMNGKICKDPKLAIANDFYFSSLNVSRDAYPKFGIALTIVGVNDMLGLNTLGISTFRAAIEPQSVFPLHTHPRAFEVLTVLEGMMYGGILVSEATNFFKSRLLSKILNPSDVFSFPIGIIHFLYNVGPKRTTLIGSYNSQNPGLIMLPSSIFASKPPIMNDVLAEGFQLNKTKIAELQKIKFS